MGEAADEVRTGADSNDTAGEQFTRTPAEGTDLSASEESPEAARIRSNIEQTRGEMSQTIGALQEKLDPGRIAEQVKDQIREKATEAYETAKNTVKEATIGKAEEIVTNVSETVSDVTQRAGTAVKDTSSSVLQYVQQNPVPFLLIGVGAGILAFNARRKPQPQFGSERGAAIGWYQESESYGSGERSPSLTDQARDVAGGAAGKARETAANVADTARAAAGRATTAVSSAASSVRDAAASAAGTAREQLSYVGEQARHGAEAASDRFQTTLQKNPLALGVAALAAGAILGLSLPTTRLEGEYMGEARDQLVDRAKSVAQETAQKVQRVTEEAGRTLKDAAEKEGLTVDTGSGSAA